MSLKPYFFKGKNAPNLLSDYDVIGFDADHTLIKYNVEPLTRTLIQAYLKHLHESFGYPKEILDFDYDFNMNVCFTNCIWDVEHGTILKLSEDKIVQHAIHGFEKLTRPQICAMYGDPPVFSQLKWPQTARQMEKKEGAYQVILTLADVCRVPIICQIVHLIRKGVVKNLSYHDFALDLGLSCVSLEGNWNADQVAPIGSYGEYYP